MRNYIASQGTREPGYMRAMGREEVPLIAIAVSAVRPLTITAPILMTGSVLRVERGGRIFIQLASLNRLGSPNLFNALSPPYSPGIPIKPEGPVLCPLAWPAMLNE